MADQIFPQIPSTVWWGVREILQKTPRAKLDDSVLATNLGVQAVAARQYLVELRRVGLIDEDGRGTDLANRWRMSETYVDAVEEIARAAYPDGLVTVSPPNAPDRQRAVSWFMHQGLGEGSAKNKAATYLLLTGPEPSTGAPTARRTEAKRPSGSKPVSRSTGAAATETQRKPEPPQAEFSRDRESGNGTIPLNLNVQIHISADASIEQIETIFSAMRKYLRND